MNKYLTLARLYNNLAKSINGFIPNYYLIKWQSKFRRKFMNELYQQELPTPYLPDPNLSVHLWGIKFRSALLNSAGMFKNGEGYNLVHTQGAGGYLGGTSTVMPRCGNTVNHIKHPFLSLSDVSINNLGLPNKGDLELSQLNFTKKDGCPIGWSIMQIADTTLHQLVESAFSYYNNPCIDFLEINISCPNVKHSSNELEQTLAFLSQEFLRKRQRSFPTIVKLSNDILYEDLERILELLIKYQFDGVNIGNTCSNYAAIVPNLDKHSIQLFKYFTSTFKGGVGGNVLKHNSLQLCAHALQIIKKINPLHEFHVIRTGGINCKDDLHESAQIGVSLNQWYTGYIHNYLQYGHDLYKQMY